MGGFSARSGKFVRNSTGLPRPVEKGVRFCYASTGGSAGGSPRRRGGGALRAPRPRLRLRFLFGDDRLDLRLGLRVLRLGLCLRLGFGLRLGGGDRVQLLLRGQLAALGDDRDPQRRRHVGEELDGDLVAADSLDRLGEVELAPVDPHLELAPGRLGDVGGRDRAEQRPGLAGRDVEAQLRALEPGHDLLRLLEALRLVLGALLLGLAQLGDLGRRRRLGQFPREQEVAREARRDVHDLAAEPDLLDVLSEDHLHAANPLRTPAAPSRAPA